MPAEHAGRRTFRVDPSGTRSDGFRSLHQAVREAPSGATLVLAPVVHDIEGSMLSINKSLRFVGETHPSGARAEIFGLPANPEETSLVFIRQQEHDIAVSFRDIAIRASRVPDSVHDRAVDCLRVQGGKRGVRTLVSCDSVTFSHASGGVCIEHDIFGDGPSDSDLVVRLTDCVITDIFDDRLATGAKGQGHAQGVYHDGGTLLMERVVLRRIGFVPGSELYARSNKNQGLYAVRGVRRILSCVAEQVSHCGFAYRAGQTYSEGNACIRTPMGFQAGHRQTPHLAVVVSVGDRVLDSESFPDVADRSPTITCGFHIDEAQAVSLTGFAASNRTGAGGWAGLHLSRVASTRIDVRDVTISHWPGGGFRTIAPLDAALHRFERVRVLRSSETMPGFLAPQVGSDGLPAGGVFVSCSVELATPGA
jgi:hypothetical protein